MQRTFITLAVLLATGVALSACASGADVGPGGGDVEFVKKDPFVIGYSAMEMSEPYFQAYEQGIRAEAADVGADVLLVDSKSSQQTQVSGSADLINQGVSALIVSPIQPSALPATIEAAHAASIPVIIGDIGVAGDYDAYVLSDNFNGGEIAAEFVIDHLDGAEGTQKIGVLELSPGIVVGQDRVDGFTSIIDETGDIEIVSSLVGQTVDGAYRATQDMLSGNPDIVAIYAANGPSAQGASRALEAAGRDTTSDILLIGFNGDPAELDLIESGRQTATVAQDPYSQGRAAVRAAVALLDGETPEFSDGETRTIHVPVQIVTGESLADHRAELAARD